MRPGTGRNKMLSTFFFKSFNATVGKELTQGQDKLSGLYEEIQGCLKVGTDV